MGLWMILFLLSKIPELIDTVFIVLRKKQLMFLHWYHHVTVLLYCWHAYSQKTGSGIIFLTMNYAVHAVMYTYYGLSAAKMMPKWFPAQIITLMQIVQMIVGTHACLLSSYMLYNKRKCDISYENNYAAVAMYASYLYLFVDFALKRYSKKPVPKNASKKIE